MNYNNLSCIRVGKCSQIVEMWMRNYVNVYRPMAMIGLCNAKLLEFWMTMNHEVRSGADEAPATYLYKHYTYLNENVRVPINPNTRFHYKSQQRSMEFGLSLLATDNYVVLQHRCKRRSLQMHS